ncbi:MAG: hypothetical protein ACI4XR_00335 [Bacilli bacterium]
MENKIDEILITFFEKIYELNNKINNSKLKYKIIKDNEYLKQVLVFEDMISTLASKDLFENKDIKNYSYKTKINKNDLFELTYDFYKKQDKTIFEIFEILFKNRQDNVFFMKNTIDKYFCGATYQLIDNNDIYITTTRYNDIRDVTILIHEYGHAIAIYLNGLDKTKYNSFEPFSEIESIFFEILSFDYLDSIHLNDIDSYNNRKNFLIDLFCNATIIDNKFLIYENINPLQDKINHSYYRDIKNKYNINKNDLRFIYSSPVEIDLMYVISSLYAMELYDIYLKNPDKAFNLYKKIITLNYPTYEEYINELSNLYLFPNETDTFIRTLKK